MPDDPAADRSSASAPAREITHLTIALKAEPASAPPPPAPWTSEIAALLATVLTSLDDSKAEELVTLDIRRRSSLADAMVVATGRSNRHVGAIADHLMRALKTAGHGDPRVEGLPQCDWVLLDAGDVMIHIFRPEVRSFYNLEKMWSAEPEPSRPARGRVGNA